MNRYLSIFLLFIVWSCHDNPTQDHQDCGKAGWLSGSTTDKFNTVANQLRGFDMAMVETGYRYQELYWAGQDQNWEYATYQVEKINKTIQNGLKRRPKRATSAQFFLDHSIPNMKLAIEKKDTTIFKTQFIDLTNSCNACHAQENVGFFHINTPEHRVSPIRK